MKYISSILLLLLGTVGFAQTGTIEGTLLDKEVEGEPLPFANVIILGTSTGTTSDFDGNYILEDVPVGTYTLEFSFIGYETITVPNVVVENGKFTRIDASLGESAAALDEVVIKVQTSREREQALLMEQRKAVEIKESIGAQQLAQMGVRNASTATTKISGVSKNEGSGDIYVRGLGDRYLSTTLNGLPVPSDDIEKKNIDLGLFSTRLIQSISVSKTSSPKSSADQTSGIVDVTSKQLTGSSDYSASARMAVNTNVAKSDVWNNFKVSPNQDDVTLGFYYSGVPLINKIINTGQSWNTQTQSAPVNGGVAFTVGQKINDRWKILFTGGQGQTHEYQEGIFRQFRGNFIDDTITDAITWTRTVSTQALLDTEFKIDPEEGNHTLRLTSLMINKVQDEVFEGGRDGNSTIFEETDPTEGLFQFIRDQNMKSTLLSTTQLAGKHNLSEDLSINWAGGFNYLSADEPNRIRNEVNFNDTIVQLGRTGGFQQRKSEQIILDREYNALVNGDWQIIEGEQRNLKVAIGGTFRKKTRDFRSQFYGVEEAFTNAVNPESIDQINDIFTFENFDDNTLRINVLDPDLYKGTLQSLGTYVDFVGQLDKFTLEAGLRWQKDDIDVDFAVNNFPGREGQSRKDYSRLYPSVNLKYAINEKHSLRLANSFTTTLPEFKEIAPFEYVSPVGQITRGNVNLEASRNINWDLKWEFFPTSDQLVSVTGFYKEIKDPINKVQDRGSAGVFSYFNSGEEAMVYGLEVEGRVNLIKSEEEGQPALRLIVNAARLWHEQDLKEIRDEQGNLIQTFRYNNLTKTDLQGASDWIMNASLNFNTKTENPFDTTLSMNYASDRIFALGAPTNQTSNDINYNDAIVEKGFVTLDLVVRKEFGENWRVGLSALNILNPTIKRTQLVKPSTTGIETEETVRSYKNGSILGLNVNYSF
ncbi:TonB-dependent receptor [Aureitalea marina]|uniref:TonB-dependent receptor n=1 Tax=Aureitalea marina TaxID=930804 RepID=A0A2S7KRG5_9FLAO|nr:TonB-dependent receptor [Aureitalea marina]PQB05219.1 TonB-dependent receptor [Aureitalea marina]